MRLKLRFLFLLSLFGLLQEAFPQNTPKNWHVADTFGNLRFSVLADTLILVDQNLFSIQMNKESILFKEDPFQVVQKTDGSVKWNPLISGFYSQENESGITIFKTQTGKPVSDRKFEKVTRLGSSLIAKEKKNSIWVWKPGMAEELEVDSFSEHGLNSLLWTKNGMVFVDARQRTNFISLPASERRFSPEFSYLLLDSQWVCLSRKYRDITKYSGGFWWNDTSYLDTISGKVQLQTPTQSRKKIGDSLLFVNQNFLLVRSKKNWVIFTAAGKKIKIPKPIRWKEIKDSLMAINTSNCWRLVSISGQNAEVNKTISEPFFFQEGLILVKAGKRYGFIDQHGFIRIACRYDSIRPFVEGTAAFRLENQWGCLDKNEKISIQPHYEEISDFRNGLAAAQREKKWGLINSLGEIKLPFEFDSITLEYHSGWKIRRRSWAGWADLDGKIRIQPKYFNSIEVPGGWHKVIRENRSGLINKEGIVILPTEYRYIIFESTQGLIIYY